MSFQGLSDFSEVKAELESLDQLIADRRSEADRLTRLSAEAAKDEMRLKAQCPALLDSIARLQTEALEYKILLQAYRAKISENKKRRESSKAES